MIFLLLLISESTATPAPNLHWCSWAGPNNTLTIGGANLSTASSATIAALPSGAPTTVAAGPSLQLSESAAQLVVPDELPLGAYEVTINGGAPFVCGAPDIYWAQGEGGNFSVAGSWLRVFGRNMALLDADGSTAERHRSVAAEHLAERSKRAAHVGDWEVVAALAQELSALAAGLEQTAAPATTASLCLSGGGCTTLAADSSLSPWQAQFWLPTAMEPGDYSLSVSNGHAAANMSTFIGTSTDLKDLGSVTVKAANDPRAAWPTKVFAAESYGAKMLLSCTSFCMENNHLVCQTGSGQTQGNTVCVSAGCDGGFFPGRMNNSGPAPVQLDCQNNGNPYNCPKNCSAAVQAAIDAAGAAGGGVVTLGIGRWYLDGPLLLPHNVRLKGAGMDRTAIYFAFR